MTQEQQCSRSADNLSEDVIFDPPKMCHPEESQNRSFLHLSATGLPRCSWIEIRVYAHLLDSGDACDRGSGTSTERDVSHLDEIPRLVRS